jgi:endonuclease/exonuclease/phosphatase family metal-dependent hydrolase
MSSARPLRLLTFNLGLFGVDRFGHPMLRGQVTRRLQAAAGSLRWLDVDIIALQEIFAARHKAFLREQLSPVYRFSHVPAGGASLLGSGLMLFSRVPLVPAPSVPLGNWTNRFVANRVIQVAAIEHQMLGPLRILNVHLAAEESVWMSADALHRSRLKKIVQVIKLATSGAQPAILLGDFNTSPMVASVLYAKLVGAGLVDTFVTGRAPGELRDDVTWDPMNPLNKFGRFQHSPAQRIDHVFLAPPLAQRSRVRSWKRCFEDPIVELDSGLRVPLSDHYGVVVELEIQTRPDGP